MATDVAYRGVVQTPWGWGYEPGTAFLLFYLYTFACVVAGLYYALATLASTSSPVERSMIRWMTFGASIPLCVASLTDVILPLLGVQSVRLATASFACLGAAVAWTSAPPRPRAPRRPAPSRARSSTRSRTASRS